jgi:hypothetical protein
MERRKVVGPENRSNLLIKAPETTSTIGYELVETFTQTNLLTSKKNTKINTGRA